MAERGTPLVNKITTVEYKREEDYNNCDFCFHAGDRVRIYKKRGSIMNVLVINCGSSSLKYQVINSESEQVLAKGLCERIGIDGRLVYQPAGGGRPEPAGPCPRGGGRHELADRRRRAR